MWVYTSCISLHGEALIYNFKERVQGGVGRDLATSLYMESYHFIQSFLNVFTRSNVKVFAYIIKTPIDFTGIC